VFSIQRTYRVLSLSKMKLMCEVVACSNPPGSHPWFSRPSFSPSAASER
jgi:hypothetical protein